MTENLNMCGDLYCEGKKLGYCPYIESVNHERVRGRVDRSGKSMPWRKREEGSWQIYTSRFRSLLGNKLENCQFPDELNAALSLEPKYRK